jgi:glycerol-3-phosphate dehydrogenase (NAD(P)+)
MAYKSASRKAPVGVIGAGSFGTAVANLLAENGNVLLYSRRPEAVEQINKTRENAGQAIHPNITATNDIGMICEKCYLLFPSVPSDNFRRMMQEFAPYLQPDHIMIHTTKGFDIQLPEGVTLMDKKLQIGPQDIVTMSTVIIQESNVRRVGCMSGPNLAKELANLQPAATVIASRFDEVIREGEYAIRSRRFQAYSSHDIFGVELAGVLKNTMALAAGALGGMGYGQNALSFLIARGLGEMIRFGSALGADKSAFMGIAGIGDLVATCSSPLSRNYTVGMRLAKGESLEYILDTSTEVAEGLKTVNICKKVSDKIGLRLPIISTTYKVLFEEMNVREALSFLMDYRWANDVDFM